MSVSPAIVTAVELMTAQRAPGFSFFGRMLDRIGAKRNRDNLAFVYQDLLCADEHVLRDIGMTRLDVLRMREDLFRK